MLKVKIKNIILFVMVLICIYLSSDVWLQLPDFFNPNVSAKLDDEEEIEADIWKVLRPVKNIIKYSEYYTVSYTDDGLWEKTLDIINTAFVDFSNGNVNEALTFPAEYLKFDFNINIPVEIFTKHMKIDNEDLNERIKDIKNIIIDLNNDNSLYIYNGESTVKIENEKIDTSELRNYVSSLEFENKSKYSIGEKIGEENLQVPVPLEETALNPVFVQAELDVFDIDRINEIARDYFRNEYDYVRKSIEVSGNLVYVYRTEKILKVNEDGLLDFYDASIDLEDSPDIYKSFIAAVNFTEEFLGFPENVYLSNVENIHLEVGEGYRFTFSYSILGRPILFSKVRENSALQIDVVGNDVLSYKRFIRKIDEDQMDKMAETQVRPVMEVISNNVNFDTSENEVVESQDMALKELKPIEEEMIKEINNIYLGYFDLSRISREQLLRVVWVVETNEKTFIFNAITGNLIEEW